MLQCTHIHSRRVEKADLIAEEEQGDRGIARCEFAKNDTRTTRSVCLLWFRSCQSETANIVGKSTERTGYVSSLRRMKQRETVSP